MVPLISSINPSAVLSYGAIGVGLTLGILSYALLRKNPTDPRPVYVFMALTVALVIIGCVNETARLVLTNSVEVAFSKERARLGQLEINANVARDAAVRDAISAKSELADTKDELAKSRQFLSRATSESAETSKVADAKERQITNERDEALRSLAAANSELARASASLRTALSTAGTERTASDRRIEAQRASIQSIRRDLDNLFQKIEETRHMALGASTNTSNARGATRGAFAASQLAQQAVDMAHRIDALLATLGASPA